jgi:FkbM family methyltransferase
MSPPVRAGIDFEAASCYAESVQMILKTTHKIAIARIASKVVLLARRLVGLGSMVNTERMGIQWCLDLREGIDFSIYLLGSFEPGTVRAYKRLVRPGDTVIDIGANIGAHTLPLAQLVGPSGRVVAFEPTVFAFQKLRQNMMLNPELASRILALQHVLVAEGKDTVPPELFSSWPLQVEERLHAKHKGRSMTTEGASAMTFDDAIGKLDLKRISFIKIDVDGHELPVLRGGIQTIMRFRPTILIELSPYVHEEEGYDFADLVMLLVECGYRFRDANTGQELPSDPTQLRTMIPDGACINAIAFGI